MAGNTKGTEEQTAPMRPSSDSGREALVVAFPTPREFPVPVVPIGRDWFAEHGHDDPKASREHARFSRAGGVLKVEDLDSRNGTFVNGERLPPREAVTVTDGTLIRVGRTVFVFRKNLTGSAAPATPLGDLVGPYGLRRVTADVDGLVRRAASPANVLIQGETGTGKELLATEVVRRLDRLGNYVPLNMAAISADLFDSTLFGHVRGAFSGADRTSPGVLLGADGGAVFMDEIGELPLGLQPKLLRFLENREVQPVGAQQGGGKRVDVVVVAATNRPIQSDHLREDIIARFSPVLHLPPLRARKEDIFAVAQRLVERRGERFDVRQVEVEAVEHMLLHAWPRNVRELRTTLEQVAQLDPPPALRAWAVERVLGVAPRGAGVVTAQQAHEALRQCGGNQTKAAQLLKINLPRFRRLVGKA